MRTKKEIIETLITQMNEVTGKDSEDNLEFINPAIQTLSTPLIMEILIDIRDELTNIKTAVLPTVDVYSDYKKQNKPWKPQY